MTSPPKRDTPIPCDYYVMDHVWAAHIERNKQRKDGSWRAPRAESIPCDDCGWSKYLHDLYDKVDMGDIREEPDEEDA